jgi:hypothetical protein
MLNQQSVTHDPRAGLTPSQIRDDAETKARRARLAGRPVVVAMSAPIEAPAFAEPEAAPVSYDQRPLIGFRAAPAVWAGIVRWAEYQPDAPTVPEAVIRLIEIGLKSIEAIASIDDAPEPRHPTVTEIQVAVCKHYEVTRNEINCARRAAYIILPRHIAMYLCRELTLKSHSEIGRMFGKRDHTCSLNASRKIERLVQIDPSIAADVAMITGAVMRAIR